MRVPLEVPRHRHKSEDGLKQLFRSMVAFIAALKPVGKAPNRSQSAMLCHRETFRKFHQESNVYDGFVNTPTLKTALTSLVQLHEAVKRLGSLPKSLQYNARKKTCHSEASMKLLGLQLWHNYGFRESSAMVLRKTSFFSRRRSFRDEEI